MSNSRIAEKLGVDRRTIDREIKRNSGQCKYPFQQAHAKAAERRRATSQGSGKLVPALWEKIVELLRKGWSREQIAGRYKLEGRSRIGRTWICHHIRLDTKWGGDLYRFLRQPEEEEELARRPACRAVPDSQPQGHLKASGHSREQVPDRILSQATP